MKAPLSITQDTVSHRHSSALFYLIVDSFKKADSPSPEAFTRNGATRKFA